MTTTPSTTPATRPAAAAASPLRTKIEIVVAIAAIVCAFIGWRTWLAEHDARIRAEEQVKAAQANFTQASTQISELQKQSAAAQAQASSEVAAISKAAAAASTPQQIVKWIPSQVPLPAPITLQPSTSPGAAPQISIPAPDLEPLKEFIASAKTCAVQLPAAQQELTSCQAQAKLAQQQLADVEKERDALKTELKGGTFWHRIASGAKKIAIGALLGGAALCASGHCK